MRQPRVGRRVSKDKARLARQFAAIERSVPLGRRLVGTLRKHRYRWLRIPVALLLILGGFAWFLPVLGLWMIAAGLLLLAFVPLLRPVSGGGHIIEGPAPIDLWRQRQRRR